MRPEPWADEAGAEEYVRSLLAARIGPVAHRLDRDEEFTDLGVPSIDVVAVVAVIERDVCADERPAEFGEVARSCRTLTEYCLRARDDEAP